MDADHLLGNELLGISATSLDTLTHAREKSPHPTCSSGGLLPIMVVMENPDARARIFPFEYAQLLTQGDDLEAEMGTRTEEGAEKGEESSNK